MRSGLPACGPARHQDSFCLGGFVWDNFVPDVLPELYHHGGCMAEPLISDFTKRVRGWPCLRAFFFCRPYCTQCMASVNCEYSFILASKSLLKLLSDS